MLDFVTFPNRPTTTTAPAPHLNSSVILPPPLLEGKGQYDWVVDKALERVERLPRLIATEAKRQGVTCIDESGERHKLTSDCFEVLLNGSMAVGHFVGPKPIAHSYNPQRPQGYEKVIEADLRIVVPSWLDPHNTQLIGVITKALENDLKSSVTPPRSVTISRWGSTIPTTYFYQYEDLGDKVVFEWEVSLNKHPYYEIANIWNSVFSEEEILWQTYVREGLRKTEINLDDMMLVKKMQCVECRWRVVSSYAIDQILSEGDKNGFCKEVGIVARELPLRHPWKEDNMNKIFRGTNFLTIKSLISMWRAGELGVESLTRPSELIPCQLYDTHIDLIENPFPFAKAFFPDTPEWVRKADLVQKLTVEHSKVSVR